MSDTGAALFAPSGGSVNVAKSFGDSFGPETPDKTVVSDPLGAITGERGYDRRPAIRKALESEYRAIDEYIADGGSFRGAMGQVAAAKGLDVGDYTLPVYPLEDLTWLTRRKTPLWDLQPTTDWVRWYLETLDALVETVTGAAVEWATDSDGEPWVRASGGVDSRPSLPAAVVETFPKERDGDRSTPAREVERVRAEIVILGRGDPKAREETLRTTVERMAAVENALYGNRTLSGTCRRVSVAEATPFSYSPGGEGGARGSLAGAKLVCVIEKTATHDR